LRHFIVDTDPTLLVALLAVRTMGGHAPANAEVVKALKKPIQEAMGKGWLKDDQQTLTLPSEEGKKPKTKKIAVVALTEEGERVLQQSAHPDTLAASQSRVHEAQARAHEAHAQAAGDHWQKLAEELEADRAALKQKILEVLPSKSEGRDAARQEKEVGKLHGEVDKIAKAVEALVSRIQKLEESQPATGAGPEQILAKLEDGFAALRSKLDSSLAGRKPTNPAATPPSPPPATAARPTPAPAPVPVQTSTHAAPPKPTPPPAPAPAAPAQHTEPKKPDSLATILKKAHDELKAKHSEYRDALVDLPALYREAHRVQPDLTVAQFHQELNKLEQDRKIMLNVTPEGSKPPEADKGIMKNNKLYYTILFY
jgi:hypothetical protein